MKTKELIKLLQQEDPTGEAHVRIDGAMPWFVEAKPGYYDGSYTYLDDDGCLIVSTTGTKVDIRLYELDVHVERIVGNSTDMLFEEVEKRIKFDLAYSYANHRQDKMDNLLLMAKNYWQECLDINKGLYEANQQDNK